MLLLLSPAKSLDYNSPLPAVEPTAPAFMARSAALIELLKTKSPGEIAALMDISPALAELNAQRYAAWRPRSTARNSRPALFAFDGDVYGGLQARSLGAEDIAWAQDHLAILSGLYGVLRPLDRLQPYRLEMGTALANAAGRNLYAYWGDALIAYVNKRLAGERDPVVVNLASQEYFKAMQFPRGQRLAARVVDCVFEDWQRGSWKVVGFFAKRARGLMARHAVKKRAASPKALQSFSAEGYHFDAAASSPERMVFRRSEPPPAPSRKTSAER